MQRAFPIIRTIEETIEHMKAEVMAEIASGRIPDSVESFSDLHDYVDANEFGDFCDDQYADAMIAHFGGRDADEGMPDAMMDYIVTCQDAIHVWLSEHGHRLYKREFPDFVLDVVIPEGFEDISWHNDAMPRWRYPANPAKSEASIILWVDYADAVMRESDHPRFVLADGDDRADVLIETDDYNAVLKMIAMWEDAQ